MSGVKVFATVVGASIRVGTVPERPWALWDKDVICQLTGGV